MNHLTEQMKKGMAIIIAVAAFYTVFLLTYSSKQFTALYIPVLTVLFLVLCGYLLHVYNNHKKGNIVGGAAFIHTIKRYEFLIEQLVSRDFKTKYKRSVLGIFWSFLNPLLLMTVQYMVFSKMMRFETEFYAAYLLCGIVIFNGFNDCSNQAMHSITGNASLITKVYVPKYIYPVSKVFSASINMFLSMIPLLIVAMISGVRPSIGWVLLPVGLLFVLIFTIGMGFFLSSTVVFFRDIEFLWGVFTTLWMYATPIIYPISILPDWMQKLEIINPMYHFLDFIRCILLEGRSPEPYQYLVCLGIAGAMLALGGVVFKKTQDQFILYM